MKIKSLYNLIIPAIVIIFLIAVYFMLIDNPDVKKIVLIEGEIKEINLNDYIKEDDAVIENNNPDIIEIDDNGNVKAIKPGKAKIRIKSREESVEIEVIVKGENEIIEVSSISFREKEIELYIGNSAVIDYTIEPNNASNINVTWKSKNENIATVENGKVQAISEGETTITAESTNNKTASLKVKVVKKQEVKPDEPTPEPTPSPTPTPVVNKEFYFENNSVSLYANENKTISLVINNTSNNITCESSDNIVAEVKSSNNSCVVTGRSYGTVNIKAKNNEMESIVQVKVINKKITNNDFLKVNGTKFVKVSNNNTVVLRGFNIGEWLSRAISLTPISKASYYDDAWEREYADNNLQINYILTKRFGSQKAYNINESYYNNFIVSSDIDKIAESGSNVVRVPVEWSYFVEASFDDSKRDANNNYKYSYSMLSSDKLESRLKRLDWIVSECGKRGIYVIFDLHVVDGGQNNGGIRSRRGGYTFFKDRNAINNAIEIWKIIARRFKDNPTIAAYELLNEPGESETNLVAFYKEAYNAIRNIESSSRYKHIIIMESPMKGATGHSVKGLKKPSEYGFVNVAYSIHDYFTSNNSILPGNTVAGEGSASDVKKAIKEKVDQDVKELKEYKIPIFIGETNFLWKDVDDVWKYAMSYYDSNLISYTFWTYKAAGSTSYGLVYNLDKKNTSEFANLISDSYDVINNKFKKNTTEAKYTLNKYYKVIRNNFAGNNGKSMIATSNYNCSVGDRIVTTIKSFSHDGNTKLDKLTFSNNIITVNKINPTGVICDGSSCQTIEIICNKKGLTTISALSTDNRVTTSIVNVN